MESADGDEGDVDNIPTYTGLENAAAVANATTGFIVEAVGWTAFYWICFAVALPGMLLLFKVAPWGGKNQEHH